MKRMSLVVFLLILACACGKESFEPTTTAIDRAREVAGRVVSMGEQTYPLAGKIVGRDLASNQVTVDHEEIPGFMAAMTMSYEVRGAEMNSLPPDGTEITATVHAKGDLYWLTDIRPK